MGYARAFRRAFDSQRRDRSGSADGCPALLRCAQGARFRQCSVQRPSVSISNVGGAIIKQSDIAPLNGLLQASPDAVLQERSL